MLELRCIRSQYANVPRSLSQVHSIDALFGAGGIAPIDDGHRLRACTPIGEGDGEAFVRDRLTIPLHAAFSHLHVRTDLSFAGRFDGAEWTATSGHLLGLFTRPLFGIPPSGRAAHLRFGCFQRVEASVAQESLLLLDLPALMLQVGTWPLAPPLGSTFMAPPPARRTPGANSDDTLGLVEQMIAGLLRYDGQSLASMGMRDFWTTDFCWHGPAPIGSFVGHEDYERGHQRPFLAAFPDRVGGNHRARIAAADLAASCGWPSIRATHSGGAWLGLAGTGRHVEMRVMDFWRAEGDRLAENWVMIDLLHLLEQLGINPLERMRAARGCTLVGG